MGSRLLAIDLSASGGLRLAVVETSLSRLHVKALAEGSVIEELLDPAFSFDRVVASLPAAAASYRFVELPFHDRRRIGQSIGAALEGDVPFSLEESVVSWDFSGPDRKAPLLGVLAPTAELDTHCHRIDALGVKAEQLLWRPTAVLEIYRQAYAPRPATVVDLGDDGAVVAALAQDGGLTTLRVLAGGCSDELLLRNLAWTLAAQTELPRRMVIGGPAAERLEPGLRRGLTDFTVERLTQACPLDLRHLASTVDWRDFTGALGLAAASAAAARPLIALPLMMEEGRREVGGIEQERLRPLLPWALACALLFSASTALDLGRLSLEYRRLDQRADSIVSAALPSGRGAGRSLKMEMRLNELKRRRGEVSASGAHVSPLELLARLSAVLPAELEVRFDNYFYEPPAVRMRGKASSFETVTRLEEVLGKQGRFASVEVKKARSAIGGKGVDFQLDITLGEGT